MEAFGTGTMVHVLRHVGTVAWDSEVLKMSVITVESWCTQSLRALPGTPLGPAALQAFIFCSVFLTSASVMLRGESSGEILYMMVVLVFEASKRA